MPDVVLAHQQQAHNSKNVAVKSENPNANGEEGGTFLKMFSCFAHFNSFRIVLKLYLIFPFLCSKSL